MVAIDTHEDQSGRLAALEKENELLLGQLHEMQEAMGRRLAVDQTSNIQSRPDDGNWVAEELPEVLAENSRLRMFVEALQAIHPLEAKNALNVRLGNLLIQSADSLGGLLVLPFRLFKAWRVHGRRKPPRGLGGKSFSRVIAAYEKGGFAAVDVLLSKVRISPTIQAGAYTALARQLMKNDTRQEAAEAARRAHAQEPQPFRLKWLAFREHEAGNVLHAEALLALLPAETEFSESEAREASRLRRAAEQLRHNRALQESRFEERRDEAKKISEQLRSHKQLKEDLEEKLAQLSREKQQLRKELVTLQTQYDDANKLTEEQAKALEVETKSKLEHQEEFELVFKQLHQVQEGLEEYYLKNQSLQQETIEATSARDEAEARVREFGEEVVQLQASQEQLKIDLATLQTQYDNANKLMEEQGKVLEAETEEKLKHKEEFELVFKQLHQVQEGLEEYYLKNQSLQQETIEATSARDEAEARVLELGEEAALFQVSKAELEAQCDEFEQLAEVLMEEWQQERGVLVAEKDELALQLEEYKVLFQQQVDENKELNTVRSQLEEEKQNLVAHLASGRQATLMDSDDYAAIEQRQRLMDDELVRAEAQIGLIRELLL